MDNKHCKICFEIKCKNCGWKPDDKELTQVLSGTLSSCPDCGSRP